MSEPAYACENGKIVQTEPFSKPVYIRFRGQDKEIRLVEYAHDEPVEMGINADKYLKGAKNIYFKYGGVGVDFAEPLYRMGILSKEPLDLDGVQVIPRSLVIRLTPPAPKYYDEIKEIIEEGSISDEGAMLVQAFGVLKGEEVNVETYINAPGCEESFQRSGLTGET
jgi:saccharopine dehydrogenase-like NADP-dependent oxidoreductase